MVAKSPVRIIVRSYIRVEDPLYAGDRRWWAGYVLEAGGQKWMDFVTVDTFSEAKAVAEYLTIYPWFPDMVRFT